MKFFFNSFKLLDMNSYYRISKLFVAFTSLVIVFASCKKDVFDYKIAKGSDIKIDSVAFSAGSPTLIADGQSELNFIIQVYSREKVTINGVAIDSMVLIPADRIPDADKKVFDGNDKEVNLNYSTTSVSPSTISFYAKVGGVKSELRTVLIKAPGSPYPKITIPVIFHVFELKKSDPKRYPWYAEFDYSRLDKLIGGLNGIFNRVGTHDPNGASANVEFVLAKNNPDGAELEKPGFNEFDYPSSFDWGWAAFNASTLVKNNASALLWNPKKYLNVWILPSAVFYGGLTTQQPAYTLSDTPLEGLALQKVTSVDDVPLTEPESVGLMIGRDEFYSALRDPAPNLAYRFGTFYGLFHTYTYWWDPTVTDYCDDTQKFDINQYRDVYKKSPSGILFRAENIMDATYLDYNVEGGQNLVSRVNTLTADQVKRIRYVLSNCPERMAWQ